MQRAIRLCDAAFGNLWLYDGEKFDLVAAQGPFPSSYLEMLSQAGQHAGPHTAMRRAVLTQQTIQIPDYQLEQAYLDRDPVAVPTAEVGPFVRLFVFGWPISVVLARRPSQFGHAQTRLMHPTGHQGVTLHDTNKGRRTSYSDVRKPRAAHVPRY
jgi:hypothetical protein